MMDYRRETWGTTEALARVPTAGYWNDRDMERSKCFDVSEGNYEKISEGLESSGILSAVEKVSQKLTLHGKGIDLGAGICWLEPVLLARFPQIEKVYCLEFSHHRIFELAPLYLEHCAVDSDKCVLCLGSFYDLKLPDHSLDFVILAQALHHAQDPLALLREAKRVLKKGGHFIALVEHYSSFPYVVRRYYSHFTQYLKSNSYRREKPLLLHYTELVRSLEKGDIHYLETDYYKFMRRAGFKVLWSCKDKGRLNFAAESA